MAALIAWVRGWRDPSRRESLADRFGYPTINVQSPMIWLHAASMGEVQAGAVLVRSLLERYTDHRIVMTTMTSTGAARVKALFGDKVSHCYLPYDLPFATRRFVDRINPRIGIILETELWPNLLRECRRRSIPIVVASGRISERTATRYARFSNLFKDALHDVTIAAQTDVDAARFKALGAPHVEVGGNIKFDLQIPTTTIESGTAWRAQWKRRFVWVAGSTHPGEEEAALAAHVEVIKHRDEALLILVPRHPQRFDEVRALLVRSSLEFIARSTGRPLAESTRVLFVDTMGELQTMYAAADVAFVGGTLAPVGGHNLLEPAALELPVLSGPHLQNTREVADLLLSANALMIVSSESELTEKLVKLVSDDAARRSLGQRANSVIAMNRGATARVMDMIAAAMKKA